MGTVRTVSMERRRELVALRGITLDDRPAVISGSALDYPRVCSLDGRYAVEFAWATVEHVVAHREGRFSS